MYVDNIENQYLTHLNLLANPALAGDRTTVYEKSDRTGTGTYSMFGARMSHDMSLGHPLLTTKHVSFLLIVQELLWFLSGSTDERDLLEVNNTIWSEWSDNDFQLGPIYGKQWRSWGDSGYDQIMGIWNRIRYNPDCRRQVVSAWNAEDLPVDGVTPSEQPDIGKQALAPCHVLFQTWSREDEQGQRYLSLQMYQRSADIFLGVPFNISSYALLLEILAKASDMIPERYIHIFGDLHLYKNHTEQAATQLKRSVKSLPTVEFSKETAILALEGKLKPVDWERFKLVGYDPHPKISAPVSV